MVSDDLDRRHVNEFSHAPMLRERRDPLERLPVSRAVPVRLEFCSIERGPLPNEPQRAVGQRTRENVEGFDRDRCVLTDSSSDSQRLRRRVSWFASMKHRVGFALPQSRAELQSGDLERRGSRVVLGCKICPLLSCEHRCGRRMGGAPGRGPEGTEKSLQGLRQPPDFVRRPSG